MDKPEDVEARRNRLQALRGKYQGRQTSELPKREELNLPENLRSRLSRPENAFSPTGKIMGNRTPSPRALAKRLLDFITYAESDTEMIQGTPVNKNRIKRVIQIVNMKSNQGNSPRWAKRFQKILNSIGPIYSINDLTPEKANRIVLFLERRASISNGRESIPRQSPSPNGEMPNPDELAYQTAEVGQPAPEIYAGIEHRLTRIEESLKAVQNATGFLSRKITSAQDPETAANDEEAALPDSKNRNMESTRESSNQALNSINAWFDGFSGDL